MTRCSKAKAVFWSFVLLALPGAAVAEIVLSDVMEETSRTDAPTATGAQWFSIGPSAVPAYSLHELRITTGTFSGQLLGYLTPTATPINLAVGQSVTATFDFMFAGEFGTLATEPGTPFRVGLFNSAQLRIGADITTQSSASSFITYTGYAAMFSPAGGAGGLSLRKRIPSAGTNQTNLIGTAANVYAAAGATADSPALTANTEYTGILSATRTADGLEFSFTLQGEGLATYQVSWVDTTSPVFTFDSFAVGWSANTLAAGGAFVIHSLDVDAPLGSTQPGGDSVRPFIWVRASEKASILAKISGQSWANSAYTALVNRTATDITAHQANRDTFLRQLPVSWSDTTPKFKTMLASSPSSEVRTPAEAKFNDALDAAVLYYLTGDEKYARLAGDILHNTIKTLLPVAASTGTSNGGWIIQDDLLLEARVLGTQLPIIYDFLSTYLETSPVYDVQTAGMVNFNFASAQAVFRKYYQLVRDHGSRESNWSALMSTCMLNNLLALDDLTERAAALQVYLTTGSSRQASLSYDYRNFPAPGSVWPESLQYASDVVDIRNTHLVLLERYNPNLKLFSTYPNLPLSLTRLSHLRYPNGDQICFGDGPRKIDGEPYFLYEVIYQHAKSLGLTSLATLFGARINDGIASGLYKRSSLPGYESLGMHNELLQLLWFANTVTEAAEPIVYPRTDRLPFAGIALQRNLNPANNPLYGLMGFVGGAGHIHSHASGMSMELYGMGQVLGAKSGKTTYGDTTNENYYRVFASNNTLIVNGASRGEGGWGGFAINTVQVAAMEPAVGAAAVSANHSFTTSTFNDNKGTLAEAMQQRTLGIVRTSASTGYYVDIFRSDSSLAGEFHDYIYRNVGDTVTLTTAGDAALPLTSSPNRFQSDIGDANKQPGWRYFENTEVSAITTDSVRARFEATLPAGKTYMQMFMPGASGREYARVTSPAIVHAPSPYSSRRAPTLVIRKTGSAWDQPFAAVYEPYLGTADSGSVKAVSKIERAGVVVGLKVESTVGERNIVQYVISNPYATDTYTDNTIGLSFTGRYAVATDNGDNTGSLYMGEGTSLAFKGYAMTSAGGVTQANLEFVDGQLPVLTANSAMNVSSPGYVGWQQKYFTEAEIAQPSVSGPAVVLTRDGLSNLLKYSLGLDPKVAAPASAMPGLAVYGAELIYTYNRPAAATDITYQVEASGDLATWNSIGVTHELVSENAGVQQWRSRKTMTGSPLFFRLNVTR